MIDTKEKMKHCLKIEKEIYYPWGGVCLPFGIREKDILYRYVFYLRHVELYHNTGKKLRKLFWGIFFKRIEMKYALHIGHHIAACIHLMRSLI